MGRESTDPGISLSAQRDEVDEADLWLCLQRVATVVAADNPQMILQTCV